MPRGEPRYNPLLPDRPWLAQAACRDKSPDIFFYRSTEHLTKGPIARAICARCPVRAECAEWGIRHEEFGVWGGLSGRQRMVERRRRGIKITDPVDVA